MKFVISLIFICLIIANSAFAQVTGLSGWNICLDPGHSRTENMGVYGYSEAERNVRVGLRLREFLLNTTDIDTVYITRTNDQQSVGLSQRTDYANRIGTAWFHSIHSDASAPQYNSTLLLWGQYYNGAEKVPNGGKAMSDIMVDILTRGMRTNTRGSIGDCTFTASWSDWCRNSGGPYYHVNRVSNMPSEISEAGFHTNPRQNQLFMNAEWKKLEAMTFYWTILNFFDIERPFAGICTGIVSDFEDQIPVNGARISLNGQTYITDSYDSLFYKYSNDPDLLHNGFYYFDNLPDDSLQMIVEAPGYYNDTSYVSIVDTFFTFKDIKMISRRLPVIISTTPAEGDTNFPAWEPIVINFNRPMNQASVESTIVIIPETKVIFTWSDDGKALNIMGDSLYFWTDYSIIISGEATDIYGHQFDGNADDTGGDDFTFHFTTGPPDMTEPQLVTIYPPQTSKDIELFPIINIVYDEEIDSTSISEDKFLLERFQDHSSVSGELVHYIVNKQSILSFFPADKLFGDELYVSRIFPGFYDFFGNEVVKNKSFSFRTADEDDYVTPIDDFEINLTGNWWAPQSSGSTTGIITEKTSRNDNTEFLNLLTNSTTSMQLNYGWDVSASEWLIREYLGDGAPAKKVLFDKTYIMQVYVFGDGSGNQFRFCVDDNVPTTAAGNHEVSPWFTIDWLGWKLISWDMTNDGTGSWIGDGNLDGTLRVESIQLTYNPGSVTAGTFYFDDLRIVQKVPVSVKQFETLMPDQFRLYQNSPNPFNSETLIKYELIGSKNHVRLVVYDLLGKKVRTLVDTDQPAGQYNTSWDGTDLNGNNVTSGTYIYRLDTGNFRDSKRMVLVK